MATQEKTKEELQRALDRAVNAWKDWTFELERRMVFGGDVGKLTKDRWRNDGMMGYEVVKAQKALGGEHKSTNKMQKEWIEEARKKWDALKKKGSRNGEGV